VIQALNGDFLARMGAAQPTLSPKMARLATFLSDNYVQAAFMTTRTIAAAAGVSLATVVRFPAVLGYPDFDSFRGSIQDRVNFDLTGVERIRALPTANRSPSALLGRIIDSEIENLAALARTFSEGELNRFVSALMDADQVMIVGFRYVSPLTLYFGYSLSKIKPNVRAFTQGDSSLYDRVRLMGDNDVLVTISFARYPRDQLSLMRCAKSLGKRILAITDSPLSPVLPLADVALFAKTSLLDFVGSLSAPSALINCVVSELGVRMGDEALERLQAIEDIAESAGTYVSGGSRSSPSERRLLAWQVPEVELAQTKQEGKR